MKRSEADAIKRSKETRRQREEDRRNRVPLPPPTPAGFAEIALRSRDSERSTESKLHELKILWRNAKEMGLLTNELKATLTECAEYAKELDA